MSQDLGNRTEDSTISFIWDTNSGAGGSIGRGTPSGSSGVIYVEKTTAATGSINGVSKANPGQVDCIASHGLSTGDEVYIYGAGGMVELNDTIYTVTNVDADSFTIGVDTTSYTTYTSGGTWVQVNTADVIDTEDYKNVVGEHKCTIDLSADAYFVAAADYEVLLLGAIIDGQTVSYSLRYFSIENRIISTTADVTKWNGTNVATPSVAGVPEVDLTHCGGSVVPAGAIPNAAADAAGGLPVSDVGGLDLDALNTAAVRLTAARAQIIDDWAAAGRLNLILDDIHTGVHNIALTGSAISTPAKDSPNGFVITWGENEANNEDATNALDDITHDIEAQLDTATQKIDVYYEFAIGGDGVPTGLVAHHQLDKGGGSAKNLKIYAYNWGGATWDQIGTLNSDTSLSTDSLTLYTGHVGTGANIGLVRIRYDTGSVAFTSTTKLLVDQIFVEYAVVSRTVGYAGGAVWINTNASNTNTESFVDGTADNPVSTIAAAITIAGNIGLKVFHVLPGSAVTLAATLDNWEIVGFDYTLALGSQSIDKTLVLGATVSGTFSGNPNFRICVVNAITGPGAEIDNSGIASSITANGAGDWFLHRCYSRVAGTGTPSFDYGSALNTNLGVRLWSGGLEIKQMGVGATDTMSLEGNGQLIINANCTGGTAAIRGNFTVTDNASGAVTLSEDARYDTDQVANAVLDEVNTGATHNVTASLGKQIRELASTIIHANNCQAGSTTNTVVLGSGASSVDGAYDPALIAIVGGTGVGQSRLLLEYEGSTRTGVVDRGWKMIPDATSEYIIFAHPGREHVNEGLAQGGTSTTITLNTLASSNDNSYNGQFVFIRSGTGEDQVRTVVSYNGTTKVATVDRPWDVTPTTVSGYVMLPAGKVLLANSDHGGTAATLTMKSVAVDNNAGDAVDIQSTGSNGRGINVLGNGSGEGIHVAGGASAVSAVTAIAAGSNGRGISAIGAGVGPGVLITGGVNAAGLQVVGGSASGPGISVASQTADIQGSNSLARFSDGLGTMLRATVQAAPAPTTTECDTDLTLVNADQIVGRVILFLDNNNKYAQSVIRASTTGGLLTYDAIPVAPASGDTLEII